DGAGILEVGLGDGAGVARAIRDAARRALAGRDRSFSAADGAEWGLSGARVSGGEQPRADGDVALGDFAGARGRSRGDAGDTARGDAREWRSNVGDGDGRDVRGAAGRAGAGGEFAGGGL